MTDKFDDNREDADDVEWRPNQIREILINIDASVSPQTQLMVFGFFYRFARFEFALKDCGMTTSMKPGENAKPDWKTFETRHRDEYVLTDAGRALIVAAPMKQVIGKNDDSLAFVPIDHKGENPSELQQVIDLLHVVRNNLFHGGKNGAAGWDDEKRMHQLLPLGSKLLGELAAFGALEAPYSGRY